MGIITLSEIWTHVFDRFYCANERILFSRLLGHDGKAWINEAIYKYDQPKILLRAFCAPGDGANPNEKGRAARSFFDNTVEKNDSKYTNMKSVLESLNQDRFASLEKDLLNLFRDSVGLSLYTATKVKSPKLSILQQFIEDHSKQVEERLEPKLGDIAASLQNDFSNVFEENGIDGSNICKDTAVKYLVLLIALAVSSLSLSVNHKDIGESKKNLRANIKRYYEEIRPEKEAVEASVLSNAFISPCPTYVATSELEALERFFCADSPASKLALIWGMSGCGKSNLARALAQKVKSHYDAVLWTHYTAAGGFDGILDQVPLRNPDATRKEKIRALRQQKTLLIIDNFDEESSSEELPNWGETTHLLFTSRYRADTFVGTAEIIPLKSKKSLSLSVFESVYSHITGQNASPYQMKVAERILAKVDYHTYATDLIARQIGENYSDEGDEIELYEKHLDRIWGNAGIKSHKDQLVGTSPRSASFNQHVSLLFNDVLSTAAKDAQVKAILTFVSMHNRWKKETLCMLLGDQKSVGRVEISALLTSMVKKGLIFEEKVYDRFREATEHIISIHPLVRIAIGNTEELQKGNDGSIELAIRNFCTVWNTSYELPASLSWLDRTLWPEAFRERVDSWVAAAIASYLNGGFWGERTALAICFLLQPFFSTAAGVEAVSQCLTKHSGLAFSLYFLCSTEVDDGRNYFVYIPEHKICIPLLTCRQSYNTYNNEFSPSTMLNLSGVPIALRNVIIANQEELIIPGSIEGTPIESVWYVFNDSKSCKHSVRHSENYLFHDLQPEDIFCDFEPKTGLRRIVIENGVKMLCADAFSHLRQLEEVVLPNSIENIGAHAFLEDKSLRSVTIPAMLEIPDGCFCGCTSLLEVSLPSNVSTIGRYAFAGCESLSHIDLPPSIRTISEGAFLGTGICSLSIDSSRVYIESEAFGYSNLQEIAISAERADIAKRAFVCCENLGAVELCCEEANIDSAAFVYCPHLLKVNSCAVSEHEKKQMLAVASAGSDEEIATIIRNSGKKNNRQNTTV